MLEFVHVQFLEVQILSLIQTSGAAAVMKQEGGGNQ